MLPSLKITLVAMAVTVLAIVALLTGLGGNHPAGNWAASPRTGAPLTLVDNPDAEAVVRQRIGKRNDEMAKLLGLPNGPVFAHGHEPGETVELPSPVRTAERVAAPQPSPDEQPRPMQASPTEKNEPARLDPTPDAESEIPRTEIAAGAYARARREIASLTSNPAAEAANEAAAASRHDSVVKGEPEETRLVTSPPLPKAKPSAAARLRELDSRAEKAKAQKAKAERIKLQKANAERAKRAAANRKKLLARRAREAATAARAAPTTNWFGQVTQPAATTR